MRKSINQDSGVSYHDFYNKNAVRSKGISADAQRGVPMGSFVSISECEGVKKDGSACRARPVKGRPFCAGHMKQMEAKFK